MKVKLVIFDLDGVLVEAKNIHFDALNSALGDEYSISWNEHLSVYDGLKTNQKLEMLSQYKGLPKELHSDIWNKKQLITIELLKKLTPNETLQYLMSSLSNSGYKIAVCSNSIRKTVLTVLSKLGIIEFMDYIISNEDVQNSKPHPEMYWLAISKNGCLPEETLIIEDSPHGLMAAYRSKANVLRVKNSYEVTYDTIFNKINEIEMMKRTYNPKWVDKNMNILIPMAGAGSRFQQAGYTFPKPLIDVNGKPMIQIVVENLNIDANFIFVVQKEHREKYNLDAVLNLIAPNCNIVEVDGITEGAACTSLLAKHLIDNQNPLMIANSDQFVEWNSNECMYSFSSDGVDAGIVTFKATHPKWSFVKVNDIGFITEVAEKNPISDNATVGFYYWKYGSDFVKYAEQMIQKNIRVNSEFYIAPIFNEAIHDGKKIKNFELKDNSMFGLGTPEDLESFLKK